MEVTVWLAETAVWTQQTTEPGLDKPVDRTWLDFLSGLSRSWPWIMLEQQYPVPLDPWITPEKLADALSTRWKDLPAAQIEREEMQMFDFKMCHGLSRFMRGIFLPPLWVMLKGNEYLLWSPDRPAPLYRPAAEVSDTLTEFGDYLAHRLGSSTDSRATQAISAWNDRFDT